MGQSAERYSDTDAMLSVFILVSLILVASASEGGYYNHQLEEIKHEMRSEMTVVIEAIEEKIRKKEVVTEEKMMRMEDHMYKITERVEDIDNKIQTMEEKIETRERRNKENERKVCELKDKIEQHERSVEAQMGTEVTFPRAARDWPYLGMCSYQSYWS